MLDEKDRDVDVDKIMQEMRQNAALKADARDSQDQCDATLNIDLKDVYTLGELLQYADEHFVVNAWWVLLRREPDHDRVDYFLRELRSGQLKKVEILGRLRYCPEGRQKRVAVRGLLLPVILNKTYRMPIIGYLVRLVTALIRLPSLTYTVQFTVSKVENVEQHGIDFEEEMSRLYRAFDAAVQDKIKKLTVINNGLGRRIRDIESSKVDRELVSELRQTQAEKVNEIAQAHEAQAERISELVRAFESMKSSMTNTDTVERVQADLDSLVKDQQNLNRQVLDHKRNIVDQNRRLVLLLEEARKRLPDPIEKEQIVAMVSEEEHLLDAMYATLEDDFRGTREDIKERQRVYLSRVENAFENTQRLPVLDLGCGRGEWLEVLREDNIPAKGIDRNKIMIRECQDRDLEVVESDVLEYLREQQSDSVCAITGFHIIEHLPLNLIIAMLDEAYRVLAPLGLVAFETPNPANMLVGSYSFYADPTHRNPLPSMLTKFLLEARGFSKIEVVELHPYDDAIRVGDKDDAVAKRFNEYFYGPQDYAAVGWKS